MRRLEQFVIILIVCALSISGISLKAQAYLYRAKHIGTEDGLSDLLVQSICKDSKGFLWLASKKGLSRWDGYSFKHYTKESNNLQSNLFIHKVLEDEQHSIWLFHSQASELQAKQQKVTDIDVLDPNTEQAVSLDEYYKGTLPFSLDEQELYTLRISDPKNRIWLSTTKGEIFLYINNDFKLIYQQPNAAFQFLTVDNNEHIWLATKNELSCINIDGDILYHQVFPDQHIVYGIWPEDNSDTLRISSRFPSSVVDQSKIAFWNIDTKALQLEPSFFRKGEKQYLDYRTGANSSIFVYFSRKGYWYLSYDQAYNYSEQLYVFNTKGEVLQNIYEPIDKRYISTLINYLEDDDYLWFTSATGVLKTEFKANNFELIHQRQELSDTRQIVEDAIGNIYFSNAYRYRWNPVSKELKKFSQYLGAHILLLKDSLLWSSTYGGSYIASSVDLRTGKEQLYEAPDNSPPLMSLHTRPMKDGRYLAGRRIGLNYLDFSTGKLHDFDAYNGFDELKSNTIFHFYENDKGIWVASEIGVFLLSHEGQILQHYDDKSSSLPFNSIRHIYEDDDGNFWLATSGAGIIRWHPEGKMPTEQLTTQEGLLNNYTYASYEDDYNNIWVSSDNGLIKIDRASLNIKTYTTEDGLAHNEFNFSSHYQAKDGYLYFGGLGGLIRFHPKAFAADTKNEAPLEFSAYQLLEGEDTQMRDRTDLLQKPEGIVLRPSDKLIKLEFNLLDYGAVKDHSYAYKIEGYSNNWTYINENNILITHLPYGNYLLKIKGRNKEKGWSNQELALKIRVLRPFYWQWWFLVLVALIVLCSIFFVIKRREYRLIKNQTLLETEVLKRTHKIESDKKIIAEQAEALKVLDEVKTRFFSNITHEFRTPLTLIIGPLEQMIKEKADLALIQKRMAGVLKNAQHLLGLINQMLDISKIESGQIGVNTTRGDIVQYTKDLSKRFLPLAEEKQIQLDWTCSLNYWKTHFDKEKWDKIVYNLLSNALKFTPKHGQIELQLSKINKQNQDFIELEVSDTGIGINTKQLEHIFDRFYQADDSYTRIQGGTGIGLALVKELVDVQGGTIEVESEVGKGTLFKVCLPVLELSSTKNIEGINFESIAQTDTLTTDKEIGEDAIKTDEKRQYELLIIDDNVEIREYIHYCIDTSIYKITEAENGKEGLLKAQEIIPDLIVCDVMMPEKNGFEVVHDIRNNVATSHIPVILLTAKASLESRLEGLEQGADVYLTKPFSPDELSLRIQKLIEIRQLLQKRYQQKEDVEELPFLPKEDAFITQLRTFIIEKLDESKLNGDFIGQHIGMSRVHLYRKLKALTGQSISEFVKQIRLEKALQLIQEGELNLSEISYKTGFSSLSYFSKTFKKAYGKTPSEIYLDKGE